MLLAGNDWFLFRVWDEPSCVSRVLENGKRKETFFVASRRENRENRANGELSRAEGENGNLVT